MKDYTHEYLLTWGIPNLDNYIKYKTMTPEKIQKIIAILTGAKTLLQTLLKPGLVKAIIINLLDAAIEVINDEEDIEQKGRKLLPKNQGT